MPDNPIPAEKIKQELVQPLLDLLEDGIVVHDEQRRIYLVNQATEKITCRSRDALIGMDCHEAFPPNGLCGARCAFKDGPTPESQERRDLSVAFINANSEEKHIKVRSEPIHIGGETRGVLVVIRDTTEVSDLRWQLNRKHSFHGMIGTSPRVTAVFETIRAVGASEYSVLITGESGTGKELAARAIHTESRRSGGPFVPVNCGALPENILESELFGHVRGAFTGAIRDKKGRFELASSGTLFLDEVGELPLHMQVKLLRVLQEKTFERVGGERSIQTDIRIVAATNRDLRQMIHDGTFREDLFYRLCVVPIELPPLRERREDIPHLVDDILKSIQKEAHKSIRRVDPEGMKLLLDHTWPGNIRELINALQYASVHCTGDTIEATYLPYEIRFGAPHGAGDSFESGASGGRPPRPGMKPAASLSNDAAAPPREGRMKLTAEGVERALAATGGNKVKAAKLLGVGRATLYRFLDKNK